VAKNYIKLIYSVEGSASMALGEVLGEARGKVTGLKELLSAFCCTECVKNAGRLKE
jgi:hypothetical protein